MERSIALVDIDNTIYQGYIILDIIESQNRVGLLNSQGHDLMLKGAEKYKLKKLNYEDFAKQLLIDWAEGLKGVSYQQVREHATDFLAGSTKFYPYSRKLRTIFSPTHDIYLVTGEPEFIAKPVRDVLRLDGILASTFEVDGRGTFTGKVSDYLAHRDEKKDKLLAIMRGYTGRGAFAFGDSDADIEMLKLVTHPICVSPKGVLLEHAEKHEWIICTPENVDQKILGILQQNGF